MERFFNKKYAIILCSIVAVLVLFIKLALLVASDEGLNIKHNATLRVGFETFDNGLVSMKIPRGWKVAIPQNVDNVHYTILVYNPENRDYQMFINLKYEGFLKSQDAKNWFIKMYGRNHFMSKMPVLPQLSTEAYYKYSFNEVARLNSSPQFVIPTMNNFTVVENFGKTVYGGDLLRATYLDAAGKPVEGIFTASPVEIGTYYVRQNIMTMSGKMIDTYYRNVYNTMFATAPEGEFASWEKPLMECLNSVQYSDAFVSGFKSAQDGVLKSVQANSKTYNDISNMVMSSWEKRNKSYDIMSQKRSDATLGYERVYDTRNGEVYKAYNGFTDDYKGKRFQPITEDMYSKPVYGYIEK